MLCTFCNEAVEPHFSFCEACGKPVSGLPTPVAQDQQGSSMGERCACGGTQFDGDGFCVSCGHRASPSDVIDVQEVGMLAAGASHRGRHHADNQDAVMIQELPGGLAIALADGVSTACHARAAADLGVQTALQTLQDAVGLGPAQRLEFAVRRAHEAVCTLPYDAHDAHNGPQLAEPQATLVLAFVLDDRVWYAWVGDSRLYLLEQGASLQLTRDDSWLNEQVGAGVSLEAARKDANAHCITQCLGMRDDEPVVHVDSHPLTPGATLLLCSDGLWNYCEAPEMLWKMTNGVAGSLAQKCLACVHFANASGGQDNVTIALYRHPD